MISKVTIENFKSIKDRAELNLGRLTVFAGTNSSGKSSVFQAILLLAQSVQKGTNETPVVLNGHRVRLGEFDDIRSRYSQEITDPEKLKERRAVFEEYEIDDEGHTPMGTVEADLLTLGLQFRVNGLQYDPKGELADPLDSELLIDFQVQFQGDRTYTTALNRRVAGEVYVVDTRLSVQGLGSTSFTEVGRSPLDSGQAELTTSSDATGYISASALDELLSAEGERDSKFTVESVGFDGLMVRNIQLFFHFEPEALRIHSRLSRKGGIPLRIRGPRTNLDDVNNLRIDIQLLAEVWKDPSTAQELLVEAGLADRDFVSFAELNQILRELPDSLWPQVSDSLRPPEIVQELLAQNLERSNQAQSRTRPTQDFGLPASLKLANDLILRETSAQIKHLGPLRDSPKAVYQRDFRESDSELGQSGENLAAVFEHYHDMNIAYISPSMMGRAFDWAMSKSGTLNEALVEWLAYLGIGDHLDVKNLGRSGYELRMGVHDLTQVGTGVSQVLPILVLGLLAEPDSTLLIEQPELHLHPKVQSLLGDFFLSLAFLGKQCLIETHSEHILDRLRYRVALEHGTENPVLGHLKFYFSNKKDGLSTFREVEVNEYGAIEDWPEGFFDDSLKVSELIMRAAIRKRKRAQEGPEA